jgi:hypothetical protein
MSRKRAGRLTKLSSADRKRKKEHKEKTDQKGKQWAKDHVQKESVFEQSKARMIERRERKRKEEPTIMDVIKSLSDQEDSSESISSPVIVPRENDKQGTTELYLPLHPES